MALRPGLATGLPFRGTSQRADVAFKSRSQNTVRKMGRLYFLTDLHGDAKCHQAVRKVSVI
jgi:uncharacterized protein YhfF